MLTFWRFGYETTSIVDLTNAMRVTAPSLYTAFGDKKRLFLEAARRYAGDRQAMAQTLDDAETAFDAARAMLISAATAFTGEANPRGCLLASATASGSSASADVQRAIADIREGVAIRLSARIARDVEAGILPPDVDVVALAGMVIAIIQGMSVLARDGMNRPNLLAIVERTLQAWPACRT
ncbi:TetR/AcrR family transcriptional regulator [Sphingomonas sp. TREG-RG-20F-R18-01]|uniref:TetR/AcrR family transcriptional regulator n=1 Tax=Sphingomonas sp. TREG-RG-20F-R18-01 TaxID=2914982 RepID=UPI001F580CA6|nr:TetR/AcrR family transcriptional regulator [Sphingomonas sp. TREG-RG-20F-R18-01]